MSPINAICNLFSEKAGHFLLEMLAEGDDEDSPSRLWLWTTLAGLGPKLNRLIAQKIREAPIEDLPDLLVLVSLRGDKDLAPAVEELLDEKDHAIRSEAIKTLGRLQADTSVPRLAEIVQQKTLVRTKKTKTLQLDAARALASIGTDQAKAVLEQVKDAGSGDLRELCEELI
jgi:HEAT repeat protein